MDIQHKIAELQDQGFCILPGQLPKPLIDACRDAFWPVLLDYLESHCDNRNRGPARHFLPMPFEPPCFAPEFFFDRDVLAIVRGAMDDRVVADQWGCDVPLKGSGCQQFHCDYQRPLFAEAPDLLLPAYVLAVSFGLVRITGQNGPIEIAPGTHRMPRSEALRLVESGEIETRTVPLEIGDVLIRHPWLCTAAHPLSVMCAAGTPTTAARSIRFQRRFGNP